MITKEYIEANVKDCGKEVGMSCDACPYAVETLCPYWAEYKAEMIDQLEKTPKEYHNHEWATILDASPILWVRCQACGIQVEIWPDKVIIRQDSLDTGILGLVRLPLIHEVERVEREREREERERENGSNAHEPPSEESEELPDLELPSVQGVESVSKSKAVPSDEGKEKAQEKPKGRKGRGN